MNYTSGKTLFEMKTVGEDVSYRFWIREDGIFFVIWRKGKYEPDLYGFKYDILMQLACLAIGLTVML